MRRAGAADTGAAPSLGDLADVLARAETIRELNLALGGVTLLLGAEEAAISRLDPVAGCLITVSDHEWSHEGERWALADFPTTAHVVADQVIGQVIAAIRRRPGRARGARDGGMSAVLLLPLVFEGTTIALLEIYRRAPQAWTNTQVDRARVLANDIAAALARIVAGARTARRSRPAPPRNRADTAAETPEAGYPDPQRRSAS
jgi:GAF domain-containing protein